MSTHATAAVTALHTAAEDAYRSTVTAGRFFAQRHSDTQQATELENVMARFADLIMAVEALKKAAEAGAKAMRATLHEAISETGAGTVRSQYFLAYLQNNGAWLDVPDEAAVPEQFKRSVVDTNPLKDALKGGLQVPWARLVPSNEQRLVIRSKKETAQ